MEGLKKLPSSHKPAGPGGEGSKQIKLLYVEDEDTNWEVTLLNLRSRYDIARARNAQEAVNLVKTRKFHAILMDIQLSNSDMDGIELTALFRGKAKTVPPYAQDMPPSNIPIIFMTAYAARYTRDELLRLGGDEMVTKPVDFTHLGLCLSRCLLKNVGR